MITSIKNEEEYELALQRAKVLVEKDPAPETKEGAELIQLALLIEKYEDQHYPIVTSKTIG